DEYDEFIANPHDCVVEKVLPRLYPALQTDPVKRALLFAKAMLANMDYQNRFKAITDELVKKYGYFSPPPGSLGGVTAPFDYLADFLRSFTGISKDVRRCPEKVAAACEALLPYQVKKGLPPNPHRHGYTFVALHMATYLRTSDFEKLFWPSFLKMVRALAEKGQYCYLFCEHDWMRYLDHLSELPENTRLYFEYGDPKTIKEKLGKKLILGGMYPITYLRTATRQQCIDKAKELLDIMAPGGNYIFNFDKSSLSPGDINLDNYIAVLEYVRDHTRYDNAGERVRNVELPGKLVEPEIPPFRSRYYETWEDYRASRRTDPQLERVIEPIIMGYEDQLLALLSRLC
ncbi:MAG TPA: uroporphyrinogen decarboxylase, partial [Firmicutes bacterium]|nr:uroporphyrinogen decarboxylase [Bacillota bacterium]